jgi:hypothetical protein
MSIAGSVPHLGVGVSPADPAMLERVGRALQPLWARERPDSPWLDVFELDAGVMSTAIRESGELLYRAPSPETPAPGR